MRDYRIVCYDFETTGLDTSTCRPIEFAAIIINPDNTRTEVSFLIKNKELKNGIYERLDEKVIEITKIKDEDLMHYGIAYEKAISKIAEVFDVENKLGLRTVIVGHNIIRYDNKILIRILSEAGYSFELKKDNIFDTGAEFRGKLLSISDKDITQGEYHTKALEAPGKVKWNLSEACKHYDIPIDKNTHRALNDVSFNIQVFLKQISEIKKRREEQKNEKNSSVDNQIKLF